MQRAKNLIFLDCLSQLPKVNAFDIWSFFDLAKFCVLFARKKWSTNFFKSGLKLSPLFPSMLDKSLKLFLSYHFTIFSHPPNPQFNDETPHPRFNDVSPCVFASSLNRGCGDSDALRKTFQTFVIFCPRLNSRLDRSPHYFLDFSNLSKPWKKCKIWNRKFGFRILDFGIHTDPWAPLAVVLRGDTTTRGATRPRSWRKNTISGPRKSRKIDFFLG